ncbi:uncharacterized protein LOC125944509 isoform X2 [Dermacentor silvarum]|uniref:uncharacterized protein LOC125944509 isoform X2 n=1 Tax=Dermacentor silvarum TaxID=543639 RepID=UPI00210184C8|nr:uncharacterized protein LOC125944509 isoform X2 [Dermacentor silvarum]XP_049520966.1 uncharacterized protein LOC125944509 isoform X2 [Dermacentor silvarum]
MQKEFQAASLYNGSQKERHVGRCRGGSCLGFRNYAATKTLKSRMFLGDGISHRGIVADSDDRGISVPVLTSADISVKGPMSKISVTERSDEHNNNLDGRRASATSVTSSNGGRVPDIGISRLRIKQVARRSDQQWPRSGTWRKKQKSKVCSGHLRKKERKCTRQATGVDSTNSQDNGGRNSSSSTSNDRRPPPSGAETGGGLTNLPSTTRFGGQDNFAGVAPGMANLAYGTGLPKRRRFSLPYGVAPMLTMSLVNSGIQIATEGVRAAIRHHAAKKAAAARRNAAAAAAGSRIGSSGNTEKAAGTAIPTSGRSNARASDGRPVTAGEDAGATGGERHSVSISISVDTKPGNNTELGTSSGDHNGGTANTGNSSA